jgi:hypothetical protein
MKWRLQYRLSTLLLLTLTVAIALGWYVDRRNHRSIVGTWHYPTPDAMLLGYGTSLEIRADGTFVKTQHGRYGSDTFEGTYAVDKESRVIFHVTSKTSQNDFDELFNRGPTRTKLDDTYECRCAVDPADYLIMQEVNPFLSAALNDKDTGIRWEKSMQRRP